MSILLFLVIVGYVIGHIYLVWRIRKWFTLCAEFFKTKKFLFLELFVIISLGSSTVIAYFLPICSAQRELQRISNYWIGIAIYAFMTIFILDGVRLILRRIRKIPNGFYGDKKTVYTVGLVTTAIVSFLGVYGILNAKYIRIENFEIAVNKEASVDELNVVMVADLHLGYSVGYDMMEQMVEKIQAQKPDIILFAGDIFDNTYDGIDNPEGIIRLFRELKPKYGMYACYGNHDVSERLFGGFSVQSSESDYRETEMDEFFERSGIKLLNDETVVVADSIYLVGRMDYSKTCTPGNVRAGIDELLQDLDKEKPVFVLDHQPRALGEIAASGADVHFAGHTHDGQFFPLTIATGLMWENPCGYKQIDNMHSIVTSGVGVYGPFMRVGSESEICNIKIKFTK